MAHALTQVDLPTLQQVEIAAMAGSTYVVDKPKCVLGWSPKRAPDGIYRALSLLQKVAKKDRFVDVILFGTKGEKAHVTSLCLHNALDEVPGNRERFLSEKELKEITENLTEPDNTPFFPRPRDAVITVGGDTCILKDGDGLTDHVTITMTRNILDAA